MTDLSVKTETYFYLVTTPSYQTSFVKKGFIIQQKDFALIGFKNDLLIQRAEKESQLCLQNNKLKRVVYVFFILTVLWRFFANLLPTLSKVTNFVSQLVLLPERAIWAHLSRLSSQSEYRIPCIYFPQALPAMLYNIYKKNWKKRYICK